MRCFCRSSGLFHLEPFGDLLCRTRHLSGTCYPERRKHTTPSRLYVRLVGRQVRFQWRNKVCVVLYYPCLPAWVQDAVFRAVAIGASCGPISGSRCNTDIFLAHINAAVPLFLSPWDVEYIRKETSKTIIFRQQYSYPAFLAAPKWSKVHIGALWGSHCLKNHRLWGYCRKLFGNCLFPRR